MLLSFYLKVRIQSACHLKLLHEKVDTKMLVPMVTFVPCT